MIMALNYSPETSDEQLRSLPRRGERTRYSHRGVAAPGIVAAGFAGRIASAFGPHRHRIPAVADKNRLEVRYCLSAPASFALFSSPRPGQWFVSGDLDGFFGLFFSGFPDLLLIAGLAPLCGFPVELVASRIMPAVAFSIFGGNLFYAWQAQRLAVRTARTDVTAIPFGVNTPTIFAYVFLIMLPAYQRTHDSQLAWHLGVFACFLSGIVQTAGAFCTDWLRRHAPRAALLCPLAGLAIAFLCLGFVLRIFQTPELALLPTVIILAVYSSRIRLPFRMPGGLLCIVAGVILVAVLKALSRLSVAATSAAVAPGFSFASASQSFSSSCVMARDGNIFPSFCR